MAILSTPDDYDEVRAALGLDITPTDLPNTTIARDVYQGAAEREVLLLDPLALTYTNPVQVAHVRSAAIFLTASRLALRLTQVTSERIASWSASYLSQDPQVVAGQLRQQGMAEISANIGTANVVAELMATPFLLAPGGRGDVRPKCFPTGTQVIVGSTPQPTGVDVALRTYVQGIMNDVDPGGPPTP